MGGEGLGWSGGDSRLEKSEGDAGTVAAGRIWLGRAGGRDRGAGKGWAGRKGGLGRSGRESGVRKGGGLMGWAGLRDWVNEQTCYVFPSFYEREIF